MATDKLIGLQALWIYTFYLLLSHSMASTQAASEAQILLDFRSYVIDEQNLLANWQKTNFNAQPCNWTGVKCSTDGYVTGKQLIHFFIFNIIFL
jgi:hypothetical protein